MNEKDFFSVSMRVIGLLSFGRGFNDLLYVVVRELGITDSSVTASKVDGNLLYGLVYFFGGLYLLRGAKFVVDFAFPRQNELEVQNSVAP
jgi:hypothetical protein